MIRKIEKDDYETWLEIAAEVEPLFGPMTDNNDFREGIKYSIENGNSFARIDRNGTVAGIIAIDRDNNEIVWLAVTKKFRGKHYGDDLVKKAIVELPENQDISVQTFSAECEIGQRARKIYLSNGFIDDKPAGKNPAGHDTVIMRRKACP